MKRRVFIGSAAAMGGALAAPKLLARAFADDAVQAGVEEEVVVVAAGYRAARRAGKPLLVIVIPQDAGMKWVRGRAFGELINCGSERSLSLLAMAEVVCAPMAALTRLVPQAPAGEPLMVLVETDRAAGRAIALDSGLADASASDFETRQGRFSAEDAATDRRLATLEALLERGLLGGASEDVLDRRVHQARGRASVATLARVDAAVRLGDDIAVSDAQEAPAVVMAASMASAANRRRYEPILARAASVDLREQVVRGSHWAHAGGCGTEIEGVAEDQQMMVACGMGFVPERSKRFLYFFTLEQS